MQQRSVFMMSALIATWAYSSVAHAYDDAGVNALYSRLSESVTTTDSVKLASIYRPDSVYMGAGISPIIGAEAITSAFTESWKAARGAGASVSLQFRLLQRIWHGPDAATDIGYSKFSFIYDDKTKTPRISYSKFVTLAQKQKDGSWAFRIDIDNKQSDKTGASEFEALKPVANLRYDQ